MKPLLFILLSFLISLVVELWPIWTDSAGTRDPVQIETRADGAGLPCPARRACPAQTRQHPSQEQVARMSKSRMAERSLFEAPDWIPATVSIEL
jgi:hypothetical protein